MNSGIPKMMDSGKVSLRALHFCVALLAGSLALCGCGGSSFKGSVGGTGGGPQPEAGEPVVSGLSPASVVAAGPGFTLTVAGTNFAQGDSVEWNNTPLNSTFVSSTEMTAKVPNQDLYEATTATIIVQPASPYPLTFGATFTVTAAPAPGSAGFSVSTVNVQASDMVWDPGSQQIYLSVAASDALNPKTVTALNPTTGQFGASVGAGPGADRLGISSDSSWLYAGIDANGTVQRFALPSLASDVSIALGSGPSTQPYYALDLEPAPGSPNTIAVSRVTSLREVGGVVVYDGSTPRAATVSTVAGSADPLGSLTWNADASEVFASFNSIYQDYFFVLSVNSGGVQLAQSDQLNTGDQGITLGGLHYSALTGYVYSDDGQVIDPSSNTVVNRLPLGAIDGGFAYSTPLLTLDDNLGIAWIVGQPSLSPSQQAVIEAYDLRTCALLGSIAIPNVVGTPVKLIRWGSNGLAFLTTGTSGPQQGDGVYIVSGAFVTTPSVQLRTAASPQH